jgi:hypothetical protein
VKEVKRWDVKKENRLRIGCFVVMEHRNVPEYGLFIALYWNVYIKIGRVAFG